MPSLGSSRHLVLSFLFSAVCIAVSSPGESQEQSPAVRLPWQDALDASGELPTFRDLCFVPFDTAKSLPQADDLRQWFDVIAGQPQGIFETKTRLGQCAGIEGIVRLKSPWPTGAALKLALEDYNRLQLHFFRGDTGVTIVYHEDDLFRWSAYATVRQSRGVTPSQWTLINTDDQRNRRTSPKNHDHYELRCIDGELILSRGDVVLVRAPLGGPPEDVFFQGKAAFHGIALVRTRDFPGDKLAKIEGRIIRPSEIPWLQKLDEQTTSEIQPNGDLKLASAARAKKRSWSVTPLPRETVAELFLEIVDATPGSGIYLGNGKDGPRFVLRYATDRRSKQLCMLVRHDDDLVEHEFRGLNEYPLPVVQPHHWLKLILGAGQVRWSFSADGIHWAEPVEPIRNLPPEVTHIGLHCVSHQGATEIKLRQIVVRELPNLSQLVPEPLRQPAIAKNAAPSLGAWLSDVTELTPPGADANAWRRACALKTLATGCARQLGNELILLLLNDSATRALPLEQQFQILAESALLIDVWDDNATLQKWILRYGETGLAEWRRSGKAPFSSIRHALMTTPLATRHPLELTTEELLRAEVVQLVYARQWPAIQTLSRELRFFQLHGKTPLLDWADSMAIRKTAAANSGNVLLTKQKDEWRELLIEELNKDVYNALAQLRVELSGAGRDDAARAIASFGAELTQGVAPHWRDEQLLVSLPAAVQEVLRDDPAVREVLAEKYADIAKLRWQQAVDRQDAEAIAMLAWQFAPTESAVDARLWRGDRALACGWFAQSAAEYRVAAKSASPGLLPAILPKLRLAATLSGQDAGPMLPGMVVFDGSRQSSQDFEKLLKEFVDRHPQEFRRRVIDVGPNSRAVSTPKPAGYQVQRRAKLDGLVGNDPNREFAKDTARRQLDWVDRQLGIAVEDNWMYVCNRFQVAAYDLQSKQRAWQSAAPPGQIQFAQESPFIASRPLLTRDRIWVRLLFGTGSTLACLDRANGQFVWTVTPGLNEELISDPFSLCGELMAFKLVRTEQQEGVVRLAIFDPRTGNLWREQEVIRLRDSWRRRRCCELAQFDDGIVVTFGGVTARLDTAGRVLWLRKSMVLPPDEDPQWITQWFQPPFVQGEKMYVTQPGGHSIECLDSNTGNLVWSKLNLGVERLIGIVGPHLIAQKSGGLTAINKEDGQPVWSTDLEGLTTGVTTGSDGDLVAIQRIPTDATRSRFRPRIVWIDPVTGTTRATTGLSELEEADPRIGPLVVDQDRIWTFWGRGQNDATRDVVELLPSGAAENHAAAAPADEWNRNVDAKLAEAAARLFPAWRHLHAEPGDRAGLLPEAHGDKDVVGLRFRNTGAIVLGREIRFPDRVRPQLRLRFGNEPPHVWKLEVRFRGETVWAQQFTAETHPQPWKNFEVDLAQLAGREGWLTVRAYLPQGGDAPAYWKSLELVF